MSKHYLYRVIFVAIIGGFLFGLNMAGISGAVHSIQDFFKLSDNGIGIVVSSLTLGCLVGALFTGAIANQLGRKKVFIFIALLFALSSLGYALSQSSILLVLFRVIAGISVGAVSVVGPMYISEIAPAHQRGRLISFNQFAIVIGILFAYVIDYWLLDVAGSWRYMLSILFLFLLIKFPESPRWLIAHNNQSKGLEVLAKVVGVEEAKKATEEIRQSLKMEQSKEKVQFKKILQGKVGKIVLLGTLLAAFQQITGINPFCSYPLIILSFSTTSFF